MRERESVFINAEKLDKVIKGELDVKQPVGYMYGEDGQSYTIWLGTNKQGAQSWTKNGDFVLNIRRNKDQAHTADSGATSEASFAGVAAEVAAG